MFQIFEAYFKCVFKLSSHRIERIKSVSVKPHWKLKQKKINSSITDLKKSNFQVHFMSVSVVRKRSMTLSKFTNDEQ